MKELIDKEIQDCMETLQKLSKQTGWFLTHEQKSINNIVAALESILQYPESERYSRVSRCL
jgi:hypothetical protein